MGGACVCSSVCFRPPQVVLRPRLYYFLARKVKGEVKGSDIVIDHSKYK